MKTAQEIRVGNVIMHGKDPMVVLRTEYQRGGRGSSTVRMKLKSLIANFGTEVSDQAFQFHTNGGRATTATLVFGAQDNHRAVSYTHLTLPTICSV